MEKIILSIATALSPILLSSIFKIFENKNANSIRLRKLDEAQKRIDLLNNYYQAQSNFLEGDKLAGLKEELSEEAAQIRNSIVDTYDEEERNVNGKLNNFQKVFLTFKPLSFTGWIWHLAYYFNLIFICFLFLGYFIDGEGNISVDGFITNSKDSELLLGTGIFILMLLLFRWLALMNYKKLITKV